MGRAIVRDPAVFLMDEPLSNLDAKLRVQTRTEVSKLQKRLGTTIVYVTHDQTEAMTLGDRLAVMRSGILQQVGSPHELYANPVNLFVAGFIGSPAMNFMAGTLEEGSVRTADRQAAADHRSCARPWRARNAGPPGHRGHPPRELRGRVPGRRTLTRPRASRSGPPLTWSSRWARTSSSTSPRRAG